MEVRSVTVESSPSCPGRVRLRAEVGYERGGVEDYWFEVPERFGSDLATSGNPWFACLLPLAAATGESLRVALPVDAPLAANAERLLRIWSVWYPDVSIVPIHADRASPPQDRRPRRVGAFFSGGVDSLFTLLRDRDTAPPPERLPIGDLISVLGFDIPLDRADAFARLRGRHAALADRLGVELIEVATNLRETRWKLAQWSYLAHGAALAAIGLSLERRLATVYIAGGGGYRGLHPWGSHTVTDPLFSTTRTSIVYDAVAWLRTEKVEAIAESELAATVLRVCYESLTDENCGTCNKCLRTMLTLDVCGVLDRFRLFPRRPDLLETVARMDASHFADAREIQDIRTLAEARGRPDVVHALDRCAARTRRKRLLRATRGLVRAPLRALRSAVQRVTPR